jgi:hypothetical protein
MRTKIYALGLDKFGHQKDECPPDVRMPSPSPRHHSGCLSKGNGGIGGERNAGPYPVSEIEPYILKPKDYLFGRISMRKNVLLAILILHFMSFISLHAQWAKTYSGVGKDEAYAIQQTDDGGYIVAGSTESFGDESGDVWIIKLDSAGNIEWQKIYGQSFSELAYSIQQTYDGGYVVAGAFPNFGWGIWVLKIDPEGKLEWQEYFKGGQYDAGVAYSIQQTNDGGYIVAGDFRYDQHTLPNNTDVWIIKLASDGTKEWDKTYGGKLHDFAYSIQQTLDGGFVVAGQKDGTLYGAGAGLWVLKIDPFGDIEWQRTYDGEKQEYARSIQQTEDGGYIVAGATASFGAGAEDIWVLKLDEGGDIEWQRTFGGKKHDSARSIQRTDDGGYIVAGITHSFGLGEADIWILKLDAKGKIEWQKTFGGYAREEASSIVPTYDGGYAVAGLTSSYGAGEEDFLILKLFPNGEIGLPCEFEKNSNARIKKTDINPVDTTVIPDTKNVDAKKEIVTPRDSDCLVYSLCLGQHTLDLTTSTGGTTDPLPGVHYFFHAARIQILAKPEERRYFSHWSGDAEGTENPLSITMDGDKSIQANFTEEYKERDEEVVPEEVKKTPCFIATAAYGSPSHPHVRILREFKNEYLMTNRLGRELVGLYYKLSPYAAKWIEKNKILKVLVRAQLSPYVAVCTIVNRFGPVWTFIFLGSIFASPFLFIWRKQKTGLPSKNR